MQPAQDLTQAIERYEKYAQADADNALLQLSLGDLYHQAGRFDDAIACYQRCLEKEPDHKAAHSRLASVMISQHRFEDAEKSLKELIAGGESDPALLHNLGLALYYQKRFEDAKQCFTDAAAKGLKAPSNFAYLARSYHQLSMMPEAIEACGHWIETAQDDNSKSYMALLHMDNNDVQAGQQFALDVLERQPDNVDANVVVGAWSLERQESEAAQRHFERVLSQDKENGRAWLGIGLVYLYNQENAKAIEAFENAARIFPDNPGIVVTLGWSKIIAQDAVGAEQVFEQALRVDRTFSESHGGLAAALAFQQKLDRAQEEIKLAKRLDPDSFGADIAQSVVLAVQGQQQEASQVFAKMLERSPQEGVAPLIEQLRIYSTRKQGIAKNPTGGQPKKH